MPNLPSDVPTGGAGVAWPPGTWNFACPTSCFAFAINSNVSVNWRFANGGWHEWPQCKLPLNRFNLPVNELHRGAAAKNVDHHGDTACRLVDLVDVPLEILEIAFLHAHPVALFERDGRLDRRSFLIGQYLARAQD